MKRIATLFLFPFLIFLAYPTYTLSIPVIIDGSAQVVSAYIHVTDTDDYTIMTIPTDKEFVLTGLSASFAFGTCDFIVKEETTPKIHINFSESGKYMGSIQLSPGIPFSSGANVVISNLGTGGGYYLDITITGYLSNISSGVIGDFDGDCDVDASDLAKFAENYGTIDCLTN